MSPRSEVMEEPTRKRRRRRRPETETEPEREAPTETTAIRRGLRRLRRKRKSGEETAPRAGAKRTLMRWIGHLPAYLKMLAGLAIDRRVNAIDKALVIGAIAYIISPVDLIPDWIPFLGQVDDIFLLVSAVERLVRGAGRRVVLEHWPGDPKDLSRENLRAAVTSAAFFLPRRTRGRLRRIASGRR